MSPSLLSSKQTLPWSAFPYASNTEHIILNLTSRFFSTCLFCIELHLLSPPSLTELCSYWKVYKKFSYFCLFSFSALLFLYCNYLDVLLSIAIRPPSKLSACLQLRRTMMVYCLYFSVLAPLRIYDDVSLHLQSSYVISYSTPNHTLRS